MSDTLGNGGGDATNAGTSDVSGGFGGGIGNAAASGSGQSGTVGNGDVSGGGTGTGGGGGAAGSTGTGLATTATDVAVLGGAVLTTGGIVMVGGPTAGVAVTLAGTALTFGSTEAVQTAFEHAATDISNSFGATAANPNAVGLGIFETSAQGVLDATSYGADGTAIIGSLPNGGGQIWALSGNGNIGITSGNGFGPLGTDAFNASMV